MIMEATYYYIWDLSHDVENLYKAIMRRMIIMLSDIYTNKFIFPDIEEEERAARNLIDDMIRYRINGQSIDLNDMFRTYQKYAKWVVKGMVKRYIKEPLDPVEFTKKLKEMLKPFKDEEI